MTSEREKALASALQMLQESGHLSSVGGCPTCDAARAALAMPEDAEPPIDTVAAMVGRTSLCHCGQFHPGVAVRGALCYPR